MSKLEDIAGRASEFAGHIGGSLKNAAITDKAMKWIETGAAIGAVRTGSKVATRFVRRNPAVAVGSPRPGRPREAGNPRRCGL